jgi:hypothetical protein
MLEITFNKNKNLNVFQKQNVLPKKRQRHVKPTNLNKQLNCLRNYSYYLELFYFKKYTTEKLILYCLRLCCAANGSGGWKKKRRTYVRLKALISMRKYIKFDKTSWLNLRNERLRKLNSLTIVNISCSNLIHIEDR